MTVEHEQEQKLDNFLYQYHYNGGTYSFKIPAYSKQEADDRKKLMSGAAYLGHNCHSIPAIPGAGLYVRLVCWWKNYWARK